MANDSVRKQCPVAPFPPSDAAEFFLGVGVVGATVSRLALCSTPPLNA